MLSHICLYVRDTKYIMLEIQNVSDFSIQCFLYLTLDVDSTISKSFWICYDTALRVDIETKLYNYAIIMLEFWSFC